MEATASWFSLQWFSPLIIRSFEFQNGLFLYLLPLIPLFFILRWLIGLRSSQKLPVAFPKTALKSNPLTWLRFVPFLLLALTLALLLFALARPQRTNEQVEQWSEGIDIVLTIDISESMRIQDFTPNRLEAAKDVARNFISGRMQDRIGLVVFSGDAYSLSPLTTDYELLYDFIEQIDFDMIESRGTAIGSALAVATNRMRDADEGREDKASKVMVLLSDGDNTAGNLDPITAAELAHAYGIKMYSIAIGKEGKVPFGKDFFGNTRYVENSLDETTLREIARIGEGEFYRVSNKQALQEVFDLIDTYEKAEIKESRYRDTTDFYHIYLAWAIALFLVWLILKSTFISNVLVD
ncbi:VWA domain-containing protein [Tunicatimonas pelagia]|uniref:VWA domain-containing protein n=1 Tax=Tunicatimonas pelagia TaxID=931531 RepID=UPI00266658AB|nr:VWA domain-containing protein [Tunicatimonas pelagia]WKN46012.1 VWA domain-containing protein [Tunicatimonas pelagia]